MAETRKAMAESLFSLSQSQRRLAHRAKREAIEAEQNHQFTRYQFMRRESDRLWRESRFYLGWAKRERMNP